MQPRSTCTSCCSDNHRDNLVTALCLLTQTAFLHNLILANKNVHLGKMVEYMYEVGLLCIFCIQAGNYVPSTLLWYNGPNKMATLTSWKVNRLVIEIRFKCMLLPTIICIHQQYHRYCLRYAEKWSEIFSIKCPGTICNKQCPMVKRLVQMAAKHYCL